MGATLSSSQKLWSQRIQGLQIGGLDKIVRTYKCVHLGFLKLLAKGSNSLQLPETMNPTHSGPANWMVGRNCEDLQMRSGVVRDEIGGQQNLDEITHVMLGVMPRNVKQRCYMKIQD